MTAPAADGQRVHRPCPMCGADEPTVRRRVDGWELGSCGSCGFLYAPHVRSDTATEVEVPEGYEPVPRARHAQILRLLERRLDPGDLVVDVGAGFGELGLLTEASGTLRYLGFEPSTSVAGAAARRGVSLRAELFGPGSLDEPAGAVVLDNVIEHVADPRQLLRDAGQALRPGGVLAIVVPNRHDVRQVVPSWRRANHWIPPEHVNYFTAASLRHCLQDLGLTVRPFGFEALGGSDLRYWPRALGERVGLYPFGLNVYGTAPVEVS